MEDSHHQELMNLYRKTDIISDIGRKIKMVRACGKNARRRNCEEVFKYTPEGKRSVGKSRKRWLDDVDKDLKKMNVKRPE